MVFGEIVEPSTRALIDDEYEEYPHYVKPNFNWQGEKQIPVDLNTLIFIEGNKIIKLVTALILKTQKVYRCLPDKSVQIFKISGGKYIVCFVKKDITTGEIIEELSEWIKKASNVYALTSEPLSAYQNTDLIEKPETLIRKLCTDERVIFDCKKLESPNLVSGLGADVLSYSIHTGLKCALFVIYMDNSPFDSINMNPVIHLMKSLELSVTELSSDLNPVASNLYL